MTLDELESMASEPIRSRDRLRADHPGIFEGRAPITLVLFRPEPKGNLVRLAGRRGPLGEFLASPRDGEILAVFDAAEVVAWAKKMKAAAR